jgi:hypothetical protein
MKNMKPKYTLHDMPDGFILTSDEKSKRGKFYCFRRKEIFEDEGEDVNCCISDVKVVAEQDDLDFTALDDFWIHWIGADRFRNYAINGFKEDEGYKEFLKSHKKLAYRLSMYQPSSWEVRVEIEDNFVLGTESKNGEKPKIKVTKIFMKPNYLTQKEKEKIENEISEFKKKESDKSKRNIEEVASIKYYEDLISTAIIVPENIIEEAEDYILKKFGDKTANKEVLDAIIYGANSKYVQSEIIKAKLHVLYEITKGCLVSSLIFDNETKLSILGTLEKNHKNISDI